MKDLFGFDAKDARDQALAQVTANSGPWYNRAILAIQLLPPGTTGTFEEFRLRLVHQGFEAPHHHNAWGAVAKGCISQHILVPTGQHRHMRTRKSHARMSPIYRLE